MPLLSCSLLPSLFFSLVLLNHYILAQMGSLASTAQADRPKKKGGQRRHFDPGGILDWVQVN